MTTSRLAGLVSLLVLGTALSVWWYLQVPGPGGRSGMPPSGPGSYATVGGQALLVEPDAPAPAEQESGRWIRRSKGPESARAADRTSRSGIDVTFTLAPGSSGQAGVDRVEAAPAAADDPAGPAAIELENGGR